MSLKYMSFCPSVEKSPYVLLSKKGPYVLLSKKSPYV